MRKTAHAIFMEKNAHLASPIRIRVHVDNLPDEKIPDALGVIARMRVYNQDTAKERRIKARYWIREMRKNPGLVYNARRFLHRIAEDFHDQAMGILEIE